MHGYVYDGTGSTSQHSHHISNIAYRIVGCHSENRRNPQEARRLTAPGGPQLLLGDILQCDKDQVGFLL
jgi:hypothetical protein